MTEPEPLTPFEQHMRALLDAITKAESSSERRMLEQKMADAIQANTRGERPEPFDAGKAAANDA